MVLITGSDGIIGRAICRKLIEQSINILPVTHKRKNHTLTNAIVSDLSLDISEEIEEYTSEISKIIHLAAAVPHSVYYSDNEETANKTRLIDENVHHLQKITSADLIYFSGCSLYNNTSAFKREEDELNPKSPYLKAKADGESLFMGTDHSTILRISAPIGPGIKKNLVVSRFIKSALENKTLPIWGSGEREQNFVDSREISELVLKVLKNPIFEIFNVANEQPITMYELANLIIEVTGKGEIEILDKNDPNENQKARYCIDKVKKKYGWTPSIKLEESIRNIIDLE